MTRYAELDVTTNFSFLRGGSHAEELVATAKALGLAAIAVTDRNTLAGVVRAHLAAHEVGGIKFIVGARLDLDDAPSLLAYPTDRAAYGRLCRLLTLGQRRAEKGKCTLHLADVAAHADGLIFIALPPEDFPSFGNDFESQLRRIKQALGRKTRLYLAAHHSYRGDDRARIEALAQLAARVGLPLVATNAVLYHAAHRRPLQDVLTCIREKCTIHDAGLKLEANAERHLKPPQEMARLFAGHEEALAHTVEIADACSFSLDELKYEYPDEPVPECKTPQSHLEYLTWEGAAWRFPGGIPEKVRDTLEKELALIEELDYARYFLTVHDIVHYARHLDILCQGRGSAANSAVCYCLAITNVDPTEIDLLFERFVSPERKEPPDIDVDFEHERREEVIQYIYGRYGRDRAGIAATVISYRGRSAVREVGKALGLSEDTVAALATTIWGLSNSALPEEYVRQAGLDPTDPLLSRCLELTQELLGFPRHLSQHVGGFVLTRGPLSEVVPIGNAAMEDRTFIEWDKDDLDALGLLKVDVLGLGMLTCIRKGFALLKEHYGRELSLGTVPPDDPAVYDMLCQANSVGVFQVESRAQMNMLPRLRPRKFYDLVIEVAIVRPGPIQGDMVHPYLRRRCGDEAVEFPSPHPDHGPADELKQVLGKTLGVPLFQEQAMRLAMVAAKFSGPEANELRRAMATFRRRGTIDRLHEKMVSRMTIWGLSNSALPEEYVRQAGLDPSDPLLARCLELTQELLGFPRHLSQHVGGFVLTRGPLSEVVPIGNAAMEDRTFIEWDKDDLDALGLLKVDVLGLGMLTCIRKGFALIKEHYGRELSLGTVPPDDPAVYDMLCKADSVGVFQVESRAQMNMLPRLKPRKFYDLVIEVAIVRPGPIQGDMVHPYLRRRCGDEAVEFPSPHPDHGPADELKQVLGKTLGVPLFQEQAMRLAMVAAKFSGPEANELRRAMATFRRRGTIDRLHEKMVSRMTARGYPQEFAERCFNQIKGFGEYGFPESHAASFAHLVYVSAWLKCHYPAAFAAALLNSQPMGFYAPAQIVRCAVDHGVEAREVDVNHSLWDCTLEPASRGEFALRLGMRQVDGLREDDVKAIVSIRDGIPAEFHPHLFAPPQPSSHRPA